MNSARNLCQRFFADANRWISQKIDGWVATRKLRDWLVRLWHLVRILLLCAYGTLATVLVAVFFMLNDQGQDLLRIAAEHVFDLSNWLFLIGAGILGLVVWFTSRLLTSRVFPTYSVPWDETKVTRALVPRVLGVLVPASVAVGFLRIASGPEASPAATTKLATAFGLVAVGLLAFFIVRRKMLPEGQQGRGIEQQTPRLSCVSLGFLLLLNFVLIGLAVLFLFSPVALPQTLNTPAILVLGLSGIVLFGASVLTYAFLANNQPPGTIIALLAAVLFGLVNDNHWIRTLDEAPNLERSLPADHYAEWRKHRPASRTIDGREPVILVAASGGGIRAAYWTATALAKLEVQIPAVRENLFAISGVSGGSVGAAVYVSLRKATPDIKGAELLEGVKDALDDDFLSPVVAGFLFPDLIQRFVPFPVAWADRQRFLELGFENAFGEQDNSMGKAFTALYQDASGAGLPGLLLNTTVVGSGRRALFSNIDISGFSDTVDLMDGNYSSRRGLPLSAVPLSAAAGASARFTYLSPAGTLQGPDNKRMRIVDGGYFENSGAATLIDLLNQLDSDTLYPILVLIRNDPEAERICDRSADRTKSGSGELKRRAAGRFLVEVMAPTRALLNARGARGSLAELEAAKLVQRLRGAVIEIPLSAVPETKTEPPLGWSLSETTRLAMDHTLESGAGGLREEIELLRSLMNDGTAPEQQRCDPH